LNESTILHSLSSLDEESWVAFHKQWIETSLAWFESIGLRKELMSYDVHPSNKLAHYARACTDVLFQFPFGTQVSLNSD